MWITIQHYVAYLGTRLFRGLCILMPRSWVKSMAYRVLMLSQYRQATVIANLTESLPHYSTLERQSLSKAYYRHLVDVSVDQLFDNQKVEVEIKNTKVIDELMATYTQIIVLGSHYGYWETVGKAITRYIPTELQYVAYKKIRNPFMDKYFKQLRSDTVATPVEQKRIYRQIVSDIRSKKKAAYYLIADQYPSSLQNIETLPFLHQATRWINSAKKIAEKHHLPIVYLQWNEKKGRKHFAEVVVIHEPYLSHSNPIATYAAALEKQISNDPSRWLWSHKRWKNLR